MAKAKGISRDYSLRDVSELTFRDWWHLIARYTSTVESKDTVRTALTIMAHRGFRHLPVVSNRKLRGVVSAGDVIDLLTANDHEYLATDLVAVDIAGHGESGIISKLNMRVEEIVNSNPVTIRPGGTILDAIRLISDKNIGSLLIVESSGEEAGAESRDYLRLVGIVTLRDIVSILAAYAPFGIRVEDCMTTRVATANDRDSIYSAMALMARERVRRLPVVTTTRYNVSGESVLGMVTNKMVLRFIESIISYQMQDLKGALMQPVRVIMNSSMPTIDPREDCGNAAYLMRELGTGGFAVLDSRELIGVITERDLIRRVYEKQGLSFFSELFRKGNTRMQV